MLLDSVVYLLKRSPRHPSRKTGAYFYGEGRGGGREKRGKGGDGRGKGGEGREGPPRLGVPPFPNPEKHPDLLKIA